MESRPNAVRARLMEQLRREGANLLGKWYHQRWRGHWHQVIALYDDGFMVGPCAACVEHPELFEDAVLWPGVLRLSADGYKP